MTRRTLAIVGAATLAIVAAASVLLQEGPDARLALTELRSFSARSRSCAENAQIGGGRSGWGTMCQYGMSTPWEIAAPRLDRELAGLGFVRQGAIRGNGAMWESPGCHIYAQTHWTRETGRRLSDLVVTRPATVGEILRAKFIQWRYATFR